MVTNLKIMNGGDSAVLWSGLCVLNEFCQTFTFRVQIIPLLLYRNVSLKLLNLPVVVK